MVGAEAAAPAARNGDLAPNHEANRILPVRPVDHGLRLGVLLVTVRADHAVGIFLAVLDAYRDLLCRNRLAASVADRLVGRALVERDGAAAVVNRARVRGLLTCRDAPGVAMEPLGCFLSFRAGLPIATPDGGRNLEPLQVDAISYAVVAAPEDPAAVRGERAADPTVALDAVQVRRPSGPVALRTEGPTAGAGVVQRGFAVLVAERRASLGLDDLAEGPRVILTVFAPVWRATAVDPVDSLAGVRVDPCFPLDAGAAALRTTVLDGRWLTETGELEHPLRGLGEQLSDRAARVDDRARPVFTNAHGSPPRPSGPSSDTAARPT